MTADQVQLALENARTAWGPGFQVHLTGGEPFLNYPLLLEATRIASDLNIPVYVETSASWCRDRDKAEDRFCQLREAGMDAVLVSVSPFHQEAIPLRRTLDGISAARTAFGQDRVMIYQSQWLTELSQRGMDAGVPLEDYTEAYGKVQAGIRLWKGYGLISGGRAGYQLGNLVSKSPPESFSHLDCREELLFAHHSHLDLYGHYIPAFCGGISLGDWHTLQQLFESARSDSLQPLVKALIHGGPYQLYKLAAKKTGYQCLAKGYAGKCHLCVDSRKALVAAGIFPDSLQPEQFYQSF